MGRRAESQKVLDVEVTRWSGKSPEHLINELREIRTYQVEAGSKQYQVEVELLENTEDYVHVTVGVDDGSFGRSVVPLTHSFIKQKGEANRESPSKAVP
jgi:hypothetical protein